MTTAAPSPEQIDSAARRVLEDNDLGTLVTAAPHLYPHQWSWDAAFISVGLAHMSVPRALRELRTILDAQWSTGMFPHIVFSDHVDYFPGFDTWGTAVAEARPSGVKSSGICQPPVHAYCLEKVVRIAHAGGGEDASVADAFVREALDPLHRWHSWLSTARNPGGTGIVEIYHGWESGMDNSPRFDAIYDRVEVPERIEMDRTDLKHADASERPSDTEYQRYLHLVRQMASVAFDDDALPSVMSFRFGDIFMTALLAVSAESLARLADQHGRADIASAERERAAACRRTVEGSVGEDGLCRDYDPIERTWLEVPSLASFSLLLCGGEDQELLAGQRSTLMGPAWMGHPENLYRLPPSLSLDSPQVRPPEYWRGPVWPIMNWLFASTALDRGDLEFAALVRSEGLTQLTDLKFGEYYEPRTGEPLGSHQQSWSAMAAIDWITDQRWKSLER
ncbi:glycogen debranching protein [Brachybacterium sp. p3-SID1565]|uniref:Glycogen debranching protein n=1 Tax=Brachybacterium epidermidis TaxID=2781983 RepID=A0ABR9VYB5_9MICO|nr:MULTISPECIES: glycogen debranching protein [Brachybacterium]MBE9403172.1 glycogen debranching protein [Brachybacterium epidermidis]MCT1385745.1 glycogen debranching protein [Brachybacterium sp. p3-SID1565]